MSGEELSADDAWHTVRRYGLAHLLANGFVRFRYGDGFSHARAFALMLALATVPLIIAGAGLAVVHQQLLAIDGGFVDAGERTLHNGKQGDEKKLTHDWSPNS